MKVLLLLFGSIVLTSAQRFHHRQPLVPSAYRESPYVSIPIALMPQTKPKFVYKYVVDSPGHERGENTHPHRGESPLASGSSNVYLNYETHGRGVVQSSPHRPNFNIQQKAPRSGHPNSHRENPSGKQHVVNFLNFASELGANVLAQQEGKTILISPKPATHNFNSDHVHQKSGPHDQQVFRSVQAQIPVDQKAQQVIDIRHPFQGTHILGGLLNPQNTAEMRGKSRGKNTEVSGYSFQSQNEHDTTTTQKVHFAYNPQHQTISVIPHKEMTTDQVSTDHRAVAMNSENIRNLQVIEIPHTVMQTNKYFLPQAMTSHDSSPNANGVSPQMQNKGHEQIIAFQQHASVANSNRTPSSEMEYTVHANFQSNNKQPPQSNPNANDQSVYIPHRQLEASYIPRNSQPSQLKSNAEQLIYVTPQTQATATDQHQSNSNPSSQQQTSTAQPQDQGEALNMDSQSEEDSNYKVVYIPLDILKNILHNKNPKS